MNISIFVILVLCGFCQFNNATEYSDHEYNEVEEDEDQQFHEKEKIDHSDSMLNIEDDEEEKDEDQQFHEEKIDYSDSTLNIEDDDEKDEEEKDEETEENLLEKRLFGDQHQGTYFNHLGYIDHGEVKDNQNRNLQNFADAELYFDDKTKNKGNQERLHENTDQAKSFKNNISTSRKSDSEAATKSFSTKPNNLNLLETSKFQNKSNELNLTTSSPTTSPREATGNNYSPIMSILSDALAKAYNLYRNSPNYGHNNHLLLNRDPNLANTENSYMGTKDSQYNSLFQQENSNVYNTVPIEQNDENTVETNYANNFPVMGASSSVTVGDDTKTTSLAKASDDSAAYNSIASSQEQLAGETSYNNPSSVLQYGDSLGVINSADQPREITGQVPFMYDIPRSFYQEVKSSPNNFGEFPIIYSNPAGSVYQTLDATRSQANPESTYEQPVIYGNTGNLY